ncbi:hypothetical protein BU26DRAFT_571630 [Trematosphaeria pertusa]|uniref:Uncharacterized protein n=1 Tax=Trematosphaeria pertusa TaxID=390896 RepID=A0A6A6HVW4_9PLEO|nr:uncharacterized protein BU26DRAFT_571630 [Trematosphaeria pertusa]KAF2241898.1 hypothetical protein BU26DRAFT_571630 [Trematosphaeria pertusa]
MACLERGMKRQYSQLHDDVNEQITEADTERVRSETTLQRHVDEHIQRLETQQRASDARVQSEARLRNQLTAERSRLNTERQQAETRIDERLNELETSFERMTSRERERFRQWRDAHEEVLYDERRKYPPRVHNDQYQRDMAGLLEHEVGGPQAPVMQRHKASDSGGLGFSDSFGGENEGICDKKALADNKGVPDNTKHATVEDAEGDSNPESHGAASRLAGTSTATTTTTTMANLVHTPILRSPLLNSTRRLLSETHCYSVTTSLRSNSFSNMENR